jgi:TetR/AcrR family transcriptional repressor of mexJK operon
MLAGASELFLERGFQGTSMDAVAKRAGVSKQTVYSHFSSKDALFRTCIQNKVESYGFAETSLPAQEDLYEALLTLTRRFVELLFDPEVVAMHRVVMAESLAYPRIASLFYESGPARTKTAVKAFLKRQVTQGRLRIDDLHYAAVQLLNGAFGEFQLKLMLNLIDEVPAEQLETHLQRVVRDFLVLYGVQDMADAVERTRHTESNSKH